MEAIYFTSNMHMDWEEAAWNIQHQSDEDPKNLDDGTLYRVTIEKVGVVRTTREVEMDGEG